MFDSGQMRPVLNHWKLLGGGNLALCNVGVEVAPAGTDANLAYRRPKRFADKITIYHNRQYPASLEILISKEGRK